MAVKEKIAVNDNMPTKYYDQEITFDKITSKFQIYFWVQMSPFMKGTRTQLLKL